MEIMQDRTGCLTVLDQGDHVLGVITDGDIRRALSVNLNLTSTSVNDIMTFQPVVCPFNLNLQAVREVWHLDPILCICLG